MKLGDLPVVQCNFWEPKDDLTRHQEAARGERFLTSPEGHQYLAEKASWQAARDAEDAARDADDLEAARVLSEMDALELLTRPTQPQTPSTRAQLDASQEIK
jgi:hypothetical protein